MSNINGTDGNDTLTGTSGNDTIDGRDGNDTLYGLGGRDNIDGGRGNDLVDGGAGDDRLDGNQGDDILIGGAGNDDLDGGPHGNDVARYAGNYADYRVTRSGGNEDGDRDNGDDQGVVVTVKDLRSGSPDGTDTLRRIESIEFADRTIYLDGRNSAAVIGTPTVSSVTEDTAVNGGGKLTAAGSIPISDPDPGQASFKTTVSGVGSPLGALALKADGTYTYSVANSTVQYLGGGATATDTFKVTSVDGTTKNLTFTINGANETGGNGTSGHINGTNGDDTLSGTSGNDTINGRDGNDTLYGLGGKDNIDGGKGNDLIDGGAGDDRLDGNQGDDILVGGAGNDYLDGGPHGNDVARYAGNYADYRVTRSGGNDDDHDGDDNDNNHDDDHDNGDDQGFVVTVKDLRSGSPDGTDTLRRIESIEFADRTIYLDGRNSAAVIGTPTVSSVTEDTAVNGGGKLTAAGSIPISDPDPGQASFKTTVSGVGTPLGALALKADGTYIYSVANSTVQYLGAGAAATDTFKVTSVDGTTRNVSFTIKGTNDAPTLSTKAATVAEAGTVVLSATNLAGADVDNSAAQLTYKVDALPARGTLLLNNAALAVNGTFTQADVAAGKVTYEHDGSETLSDSLAVTLSDGTASTGQTTLALAVTPVNDPAVISGTASGAVTEAGGVANGTPGTPAATGTLTATDADSPATFTPVASALTAGGYGSYTMTAGGVWDYTLDDTKAAVQALNATQTLSDTFTVSTADGTTKLVTVSINGSNDSAVISGTASGSVTEAGGVSNGTPGTPAASGTLTDTDVDNPANTFQPVSAGTASSSGYGTYSMTAGGSWSYALDNANTTVQGLTATQMLSDSFTVQTADGTQQAVTIAVNGANDSAVIGAPTSSSVVEDANVDAGDDLTVRGSISVTDAEAGEAIFKTTVGSAPGNLGTLVMATNGAYLYSVANSAVQNLGAGDTKVESFTVTSVDGTTKGVSFTIHGANDAAAIGTPTVADVTEDAATPDLVATGSIVISDADQNQSAFQAITGKQGNLGTLGLASDGSYSYTVASSAVQYLGAGDTRVESFAITSFDGTTKGVSFTIHGANDAAVIGTPTVADVTEDAATPDLVATGSIVISDADQNQSAFQAMTGKQGNLGTLSLASDGSYSYTVANSAVQNLGAGDTRVESFTVTAVDGTTKGVSFTIRGANDAAVIGTPTVAEVTEDAATPDLVATGSIVISDADQNQSAFQATTGKQGNLGTLGLASDGSYSYTVANSAVQNLGAGDTRVENFAITAFDGTTKGVSFTIHGANDAPALTGPVASFVAGTEDIAYTVSAAQLLTGFTDVDGDTLSVTGLVADHGAVTDNGNGTYNITPAHNYNGAVALSYKVSDGQGGTTSATQSFSLAAVNDAPVAVADFLAATAGKAVTYTAAQLLGNDSDGDPELTQTLTIASVASGIGGTAVLDGSSVTFTPAAGFDGPATFTYTVSDGPLPSAPATVTVDVAPAGNTAPEFAPPGATLNAGVEDVAYTVTAVELLTGYTDADGDALSVRELTAYHGSVIDNGNGSYTITPAANYNGPMTLSYTVSDGHGGNTPAAQNFSLASVNDPAVISGTASGSVTEARDGTAGTPTASGTLTNADVDNPANTFLEVIAGTPSSSGHGTVAMTSSGVWTYTLDDTKAAVQALNATQTLSDSFTVRTADGTPQVVTITINGANDAAVIAGAATGTVVEAGGIANGTPGTPTASGTLTDADVDNPANTFQAVVAGTPSSSGHGTVGMTSAGVWTYTLDEAAAAVQGLNTTQTLSDSFTVRTADGTPQVVTITINGANDAAVIAGAATGTVVEAGGLNNASGGTPTAVGALIATDVDSSAAFTAVATAMAGDRNYGTYTIDATGNWSYTLDNTNLEVQGLNPNGHLTDTFTVTTDDGTAQLVAIKIHGANDAPVLNVPTAITYTDSQATDSFTVATGSLSATDVDTGAARTYVVTGGALSSALAGYDVAKAGLYGTLYVNSASGAYSFVPDSTSINALPTGTNTSDTFTLMVSDGVGGTDSKALTVDIQGANDASVISGVSGPLKYTVGQAPVVVAPALTLGDADSGFVSSATVVISAGYSAGNDLLEFQLPTGSPISGVFVNGVLSFTGTATLAEYQAALDSVTFHTNIIGGRTVSFTVFDGTIASVTVDTSSISLASTLTNGFKIPGEAAGDNSGFSMSRAGDINGDGFADLIIGAPAASPNGNLFIGRSYVVFGQGSAFDPEVPLWSLDGSNGFRLSGVAEVDVSGFSVAGAGDVNGDGFDDVIIGAIYADSNDVESGAAYVVFGKASGWGPDFQLSSLNGANGFRLAGVAAGDQTGISVSGAGDVNGDGYDDVLVGSYNQPYGASYLVFGRASGFAADIQLSALDGIDGLRIAGEAQHDNAGQRLSAAGDVNGDGFADILIGAPGDFRQGYGIGADYVVFGKASFFSQATAGATLSLADLDGTNGFRMEGLASADGMGIGLGSAGDINGDGFDEVIVGARFAQINGVVTGDGVVTGASYVVFGQADGFGRDVHLSGLHGNGTGGFRISGGAEDSMTGYSVSGAGDFNGDGFGDLIVGAPGIYGSPGWSGESYVVFGRASGFANVDLATLGGADGFRVSGVANQDASGYSVRAAGDVNGDGFDDIAVSSARASPHGQTEAGETYVIFGARLVTGGETYLGGLGNDTLTGTGVPENFIGGQGNDTIFGNGGRDAFSGGAGDDTIHLGAAGQPAIDFIHISGGSGFDTLALDGAGVAFDFTLPGADRVQGIERIDLTGSGGNTLELNLQDVVNMSDSSNRLFVTGNAGDAVISASQGWLLSGQVTDHGITYDSYTPGGAAYAPGMPNLLVDIQLLGVDVSVS